MCNCQPFFFPVFYPISQHVLLASSSLDLVKYEFQSKKMKLRALMLFFYIDSLEVVDKAYIFIL